MTGTTNNILDGLHPVLGLAPAVPSSTTPAYVSTKLTRVVGALITITNTTGVTGSAIGLQQATAVAGTSAKVLGFTDYYARTDCLTTDAPWVRSTAASNTFTSATTSSKSMMYFIPINPQSLDTNNSFDCVGVTTGNAVNATVVVHYLCRPDYSGNAELFRPLVAD